MCVCHVLSGHLIIYQPVQQSGIKHLMPTARQPGQLHRFKYLNNLSKSQHSVSTIRRRSSRYLYFPKPSTCQKMYAFITNNTNVRGFKVAASDSGSGRPGPDSDSGPTLGCEQRPVRDQGHNRWLPGTVTSHPPSVKQERGCVN